MLDVACGTGNFTRDFARTVGPDGLAVGIDASATMLTRAVADTDPPAGWTRSRYVRGDAQELPFRDHSFDAVCCFAALHLFADPMRRSTDDRGAHAGRADRDLHDASAGARRRCARSSRSPAPAAACACSSATRSCARSSERGFAEIRQRIAGVTQFVGGRLAE